MLTQMGVARSYGVECSLILGAGCSWGWMLTQKGAGCSYGVPLCPVLGYCHKFARYPRFCSRERTPSRYPRPCSIISQKCMIISQVCMISSQSCTILSQVCMISQSYAQILKIAPISTCMISYPAR